MCSCCGAHRCRAAWLSRRAAELPIFAGCCIQSRWMVLAPMIAWVLPALPDELHDSAALPCVGRVTAGRHELYGMFVGRDGVTTGAAVLASFAWHAQAWLTCVTRTSSDPMHCTPCVSSTNSNESCRMKWGGRVRSSRADIG